MDRNSLVSLTLAGVLGATLGVSVWVGVFIPSDPRQSNQILFHVEKGENAKDISLRLRDAGFLRFVTPFRLFLMLTNTAHRLQAGDYMIGRAMTPYAISQKFLKGDIIKEHITVIEGWTAEDIAKNIEEKTNVSKEAFLEATRHSEEYRQTFSVLEDKPKSVGLEGYLFPDTYEILPSDDANDVIKKMLANTEKKLTPELRAKALFQHRSIFQVFTMASLLEKELKSGKEKKIGAGILWTRLRIGMPLQVDATVEYAPGSSYDTYKHRGLPLGPIANPGMESIEATLNPTETPYLYYLTKRDGTAVFSRTLEEHNAAKNLYLR